MSESLLLVQPHFSEPGHFAHFTLLNARALNSWTKLKVLVYVHEHDPGHEAVLQQLVEMVPTEVIRGSRVGWRQSTWRLYKHLPAMLQQTPGVRHIFFLDPSLMTLATALIFRPLQGHCPVTATELFGPELYLNDYGITIYLKRLLLHLAARYRHLRLAPFTAELADSWHQSGLLPPEASVVLPTLQMTYSESPPYKDSVTSRSQLVFALVGSLRSQKNVDRIVPIFRDGTVSGKLILAGEVLGDLMSSSLPSMVDRARGRIDFQPRFLSEAELHTLVGTAHYNLLLYVDFDERMESAMLFTSARLGTPIIGTQHGWLGRMVKEYQLGYAINPYDADEIRHCLSACELPGSPDYRRFEQGLRNLLADYRQEIVVPKFLNILGLSAAMT